MQDRIYNNFGANFARIRSVFWTLKLRISKNRIVYDFCIKHIKGQS